MKEVRVAIVGYGGIARLHYTAYCRHAAAGLAVRVVAVCTKDTEGIYEPMRINFDAETETLDRNIPVFSDLDEMLRSVDFDMADICLPTVLHAPFAIRLLKAGKHVLCEKPMALTSADCAAMCAAEQEGGGRLMIAHSLRFSAPYRFLRDAVADGRFGKLRHLTMARLSEYPRWSPAFLKEDTTGGCILDMHIHEVDMILAMLGTPQSVSAVYYSAMPYTQVGSSRFTYPEVTVLADHAWDEARTTSFESRYSAYFEGYTVVCENGNVAVKPWDGERYEVELSDTSSIEVETRIFVEALLGHGDAEVIPSALSEECVRIVERLRESAADGGKIINI